MSHNFCVKHICSQIRHGPRKLPPKVKNGQISLKSYFGLKQRVLGGLLWSAKVTAAKFCVEFWYQSFLCGHFWPFIILKPVALARVKHRALYFLRVGPAEAFIVMKRGSHISVRISQTNFSCFTDPPKCPLKVGSLKWQKFVRCTVLKWQHVFHLFMRWKKFLHHLLPIRCIFRG